mgnify:CR=1 FL=1
MKNPIYRKELKQYARSRRAMWTLVAFNLILQLIGLFVYYISFARMGNQGLRIHYADILTVYRILVLTEFLLVMCVVPAISSGAVCGEREKQTFDPLLSTPMSPLQIVLGKLSASLHIVILLLISALPTFGLVFSIGGIRIRDLCALYICLILQAVVFGSSSILISAHCRKTATATVLSYLTMFLVVLGTMLIVGACYALSAEEGSYVTMEMVYRGMAPNEAAVRNWNLLLLLNPSSALLALFREQTGSAPALLLEYGSKGGAAEAIREHWLVISVVLQIAVVLLFQFLSIRRLSRME